ncbi:hypothetical protein ACHAXT_011922 [Thalassiosira profunda]
MAKKRTKKRAPKKRRGGGDESGAAGACVLDGGVEQPGVAPSPEEPGRDDEQREPPPKLKEEDAVISGKGDIFVNGEREVTRSFSASERSRILLASMNFELTKQGEYPPLSLERGDLVVEAKMEEGFDRYKEHSEEPCSVPMTYEEYWALTEDIIRVWEEQIMSDGFGFIAHLMEGDLNEERLVYTGSVMPCHPFDALVFLMEDQYSCLFAETSHMRPRAAIVTDILDNLSPAQATFVRENNRTFRVLFMNYKGCSVNRFFDTKEDITQADLVRWKSLGGGHGEDEDDTPIQKRDLPQNAIAMVAKI